MWKDIDSAPKNKCVILGVDSYDCGWVYDTGVFDNGKWKVPHIDGTYYNHMHYSHWYDIESSEVNWKHIGFAPKNKVILLGKVLAGGEMTYCSAWYYHEQKCWITTGGHHMHKIEESFNLFTELPDLI